MLVAESCSSTGTTTLSYRLPICPKAYRRQPRLGDQAQHAACQEHLARHADFQNQAFVALNTAFLEDGAFIEIPRGVILETPIHLLVRFHRG